MKTFIKLDVYDFVAPVIALAGIPLKLLCDKWLISRDRRELSAERRAVIQNQLNNLAFRADFYNEISLVEMHGKNAYAMNNINKPVIAINTEEFREENPLQEFILAQKIIEIKRSNWTRCCLYAATAAMICKIAIKIIFSQITEEFVDFFVDSDAPFRKANIRPPFDIGFLGGASYGIFKEAIRRNDRKAFMACSINGRAAVINNLREQHRINLDYRNAPNLSKISQLWRKFLICEIGNFRFNLFQNSISDRLIDFQHLALSQRINRVSDDISRLRNDMTGTR